jgi:hypothetical protein
MTTIDDTIIASIFDFITGLVREIEPDVEVTPFMRFSLQFHNRDFFKRMTARQPHDYADSPRPWAAEVEVWDGKVYVSRIYGDEPGTAIELADPNSFEQIEAALHRYCRPHWEDGGEGQP